MKSKKPKRVSIRQMVESDIENNLDSKLDHPIWGDPMTKFSAKLPDVLSPEDFGRELTKMLRSQNETNISPFYKYFLAGKLSKDGVREWVKQHYFDVRNFTTTIAQIVANAHYQYDIRQVFGLNLMEELGELNPAKEHPILFLKVGRALGLTDEEMEFATPIPEMLISLEYRLKHLRELDVVSSVAAGAYVLEATVAERHRKIANALKEHYGLKDSDLEFFLVHCGGLEEGEGYGGDWVHAAESLHFIKKYANTAESQERVRQACWKALEARKVCHAGYFRALVLKDNPDYQALVESLIGTEK